MINDQKKIDTLIKMTKLVDELSSAISSSDLQNFGEILNENWILKKSLSNKIADNEIDEIYNTGLKSGALGGKVLGAGGGGFILFYCPLKKQKKLRQNLNKLKELNFKFDRTGAKIIYVGDLNKKIWRDNE